MLLYMHFFILLGHIPILIIFYPVCLQFVLSIRILQLNDSFITYNLVATGL